LVSARGMELATGSLTVTNPITGEQVTPPESSEGDSAVLIAAILIALTLVAGFVLRGAIAAGVSIAGLAIAAALISYSVLIRLPEQAREGATAGSAQGISEAQLANLIRVEVAAGFWLTLVAIIAAIVITFLARNETLPGRH
jgi:hypothetical protein